MNTTKQQYVAPTVREIGSIAEVTLGSTPVSTADTAIPANAPLTSSGQ